MEFTKSCNRLLRSRKRGAQSVNHRPRQAERVDQLDRIGKQIVGYVLITDRTQKSLDRGGADGGGARIRNRRDWLAMNHCRRHFDARGPAIDQDTSYPAFKQRH